MCETKETKFNQLFKQESFKQFFNTRCEIFDLLDILTEDEIDTLNQLNVIFIRSCSPSSIVSLNNLDIQGKLTLINIEYNYYSQLLPDEFIAIILHEIGHAFNPETKGMEGEYIADNFAEQKGYAKWIVSSLEKGMKKQWIGFDVDKCQPRIDKLRNPN